MIKGSKRKNLARLFSWQKGNSVVLLKDGTSFFPRMLECIEGAKAYILLEMYLFESGKVASQFIEALVKTAGRGAGVYLLIDDFGSFNLSAADRVRLKNGGVTLTSYNPLAYGKWRHNLHRNHRKLLIVDGKVAYTGGTGITDSFGHKEVRQDCWRETMAEIEGPVVADWQRSFEEIWNRWADFPINLPTPQAAPHPANMTGRVSISESRYRQEVVRSLIKRIRNAKRHVWIGSAYFIPTWKIRRALRKAAARGIDVRLLLPGPQTDHPAIRQISRRYYQRLLQSGVRIHEYEPRFLHIKVLLCDNWVSVGSSNFDRWSLRWNLEANQEVEDSSFSMEVRRMFMDDFSESIEIVYSDWLLRPWHRRLLESFWYTVIMWTEYLSHLKSVQHPLSRQRDSKSTGE